MMSPKENWRLSVYDRNKMKTDIYKNLYSDQKNSGDLAKSIRIKKMVSIIDHLNLHEANILDIGCHDGTLLSLIRNKNNHFFGLDASDWAVEESRKKSINIRSFFFDGKAELPFEDDFFDIIIAGEIIEHIYDTDFFLEEIKRVLKSKGGLLLSTPNVASLGRRLLLLFGISSLFELSPNEAGSVGHIRYFTFKTLKKLLAKHGFDVIISQSDCVNFSNNGNFRSTLFAKLFPKLGASIIVLAKKKLISRQQKIPFSGIFAN